jgi:hypothetical protein
MARILIQIARKRFVTLAAARSAGEFVSPAQQSCVALGFVRFVIKLTHCQLPQVFIMFFTISHFRQNS